jgi:hypothetical protein
METLNVAHVEGMVDYEENIQNCSGRKSSSKRERTHVSLLYYMRFSKSALHFAIKGGSVERVASILVSLRQQIDVHPEVRKLGIDKKICKFIEILDLDEKPESYHPRGASEQYKRSSSVGETGNMDLEELAAAGNSTKRAADPPDIVENGSPGASSKQPPMRRTVNISQLHAGGIVYDDNAVDLREATQGQRNPQPFGDGWVRRGHMH